MYTKYAYLVICEYLVGANKCAGYSVTLRANLERRWNILQQTFFMYGLTLGNPFI